MVRLNRSLNRIISKLMSRSKESIWATTQKYKEMGGPWEASGTEARMRTFSIQQIKVPEKENREKTWEAILEVMIAKSSKWQKTGKYIRHTSSSKQKKFLKAAAKQNY